MKEQLRNLKGSPARDAFKWLHKQNRNYSHHYAIDVDMLLMEGTGICAVLDVKRNNDTISTNERFAYDSFVRDHRKPVYAVYTPDGFHGPYGIKQYFYGGRLAHICTCADMTAVHEWEEAGPRQAYRDQRGRK